MGPFIHSASYQSKSNIKAFQREKRVSNFFLKRPEGKFGRCFAAGSKTNGGHRIPAGNCTEQNTDFCICKTFLSFPPLLMFTYMHMYDSTWQSAWSPLDSKESHADNRALLLQPQSAHVPFIPMLL